MDSNLSTALCCQRAKRSAVVFVEFLTETRPPRTTFGHFIGHFIFQYKIKIWQTTVQFLVVFHGKLPLFATSSGQGHCLLLIKEVQ